MKKLILFRKNTLENFHRYMEERELSEATREKYLRDVRELAKYVGRRRVDKEGLIGFRESLRNRGLSDKSVNSMVGAVNCFLRYCDREDLKLRGIRIQRKTFSDAGRELTRKEYEMMVRNARDKRDRRMEMLVMTLVSLGIRISELSAITVESLHCGKAVIKCKAKLREILLPRGLTNELLRYSDERGIKSGPIFITRSGRPMDRSNIWRSIKQLAGDAGVDEDKAYPHGFRHFFARQYYGKYKDVVRLSDILGHSSLDTTRIYTMHSGAEQARQMDELGLIV